MNSNSERRSETRLDENATVFIEVAAANPYEGEAPKIIICKGLDISANGIQVQMDEEVQIGCIMRLCAEFHSGREPIYLVGEARWVRHCDAHYFVGFEIFDAENTDIVAWKTLVAAYLGAAH